MINPFESISQKNQEKLLQFLHGYTLNYPKEKQINDLIDDSDEIGVIISGHIQVTVNNYNGTISLIDEFKENDIIGSSLLLYKNDECDIVAKEDTQIIVISYSELISQNINDKYYNQFIRNLFIILNEKIKEKNERIEILTKKTIRNKLLEYFNINSKKSGSRYIYLPFNFADLANYLAVDRSAMSRELGYLKEEGIIEVKGKRITLLYR